MNSSLTKLAWGCLTSRFQTSKPYNCLSSNDCNSNCPPQIKSRRELVWARAPGVSCSFMGSRPIALTRDLLESSWRSTSLRIFPRCMLSLVINVFKLYALDTFDRVDDQQFALKKMTLVCLLSPKSRRLSFFVQASTLYTANAIGTHGNLYR